MKQHLKSLYRSPLKTGLTLLLLAAAAFLFLYNLSEYAVSDREYREARDKYEGVLTVEAGSVPDNSSIRDYFLLTDETNPGNTHDWEGYEKGMAGLAIVNGEGEVIPNSVSYEKLIELNSDYEKYVNRYLFQSKMKSSMELIPQESIISSVKIGNKETSDNIYSVNRIVKCDFYKKYVIKDFLNDGKCNHNHKQNKYDCNYFKIFKGNLRASNYYLLFDESEKYNAKYFIDNTKDRDYESWKNVISDEVYLNDHIDFDSGSSAIIFVHIDKPKTKAVLVSVPKDFDKRKLKYDYFRTNECEFILKAWY